MSRMQRRATSVRRQAQQPTRRQRSAQRLAGGALLALTLWLLVTSTSALPALAASTMTMPLASQRLPPTASCEQLAHADPTATNGALWGKTILPGLGASGGWFGVPVCANGVTAVAPGGANVSCDATPTDLASDGCAPGRATNDGYGLSFQCVELVARFAGWAYGDAPAGWRGDASYLWLQGHHPAEFTAEREGVSLQAPQPGDILVWGSLDSQGRAWPAGPAGGHVAVVAAVGGGQITFVEENMLGHRGAEAINIPSETTTLSRSATGGWTIGPTYGLNGGRALYGWLHSARDTGHFPTDAATGVATTSTSSASTPSIAAPTAPSASSAGTLPSLAQGVVVTPAGALAALVWSDTHTPDRPNGSSVLAPSSQPAPPPLLPQAVIEPLGTPPGMTLAADQTPAIVTLPTGERYIFMRGEDGALYSVYTSPQQTSVAWQALGAPPGVTLTGEVSALWSRRDGIEVGALGSDGGYWLCSGPAGMLGVWLSLGHPAETAGFQGSAILTLSTVSGGQSASGATGNGGRRALAMGVDGRLYEADWSGQVAANASSSGGTVGSTSSGTPSPTATTATVNPSSDMPPGWSAWTSARLPGVTIALSPSVIVATTAPPPPASASAVSGQASQGAAAGALGLVVTDARGQDWLLHSGAAGQAWQVTPLRLRAATSVAVAATVLGPTRLAVYTADAVATVAAPARSAQPGSASGSAPSATLRITPEATPAENLSPTPTVPAHAASATISQATRSAPASAQRSTQAQVSLGIFTLGVGVSGATAANAPSVGSWTTLGDVTLAPASSGASGPVAATAPSSVNQTATPTSASTSASSPGDSDLPATVVGTPIMWQMGAASLPDSVFLDAQGGGVTLLGTPATLRLLAPSLTSSSVALGHASHADAEPAGSLILGEVANPAVFSDAFAGGTLDPRWVVTTTSDSSPATANATDPASQATATAQVGRGALTLLAPPTTPGGANGSAHAVTITQGAPAGDFAVTVQVDAASAAGSTPDAGMQSGIALRLDAWNQVTLALRVPPSGMSGAAPTDAPIVALCADAAGKAPWCSAPMPLPARPIAPPVSSSTTSASSQSQNQAQNATPAQGSPQDVYLRISASGATVTGAVSLDGTQWTTVGSWTLAWLPTSATALGGYAPPLAMSAGENGASPAPSAPGAATWQRFTSVGLFVSATVPTGTTTAMSAGTGSAQFSGFSVVPVTATGQSDTGAAG